MKQILYDMGIFFLDHNPILWPYNYGISESRWVNSNFDPDPLRAETFLAQRPGTDRAKGSLQNSSTGRQQGG